MTEAQIELVLTALSIIVYPICLWFWRRIAELKRDLDEERASNASIRDRVARCEAQIENTPSKESVHKLMLELSSMSGGLKAMEVKLEGFDGSVRRSERVMERVERYLLENAR